VYHKWLCWLHFRFSFTIDYWPNEVVGKELNSNHSPIVGTYKPSQAKMSEY